MTGAEAYNIYADGGLATDSPWYCGGVYCLMGPDASDNGLIDPLVAVSSLSLTDPVTPLPAALPLFFTGLGVVGLLARRKKQKNAAAIAAA